MNQSLKDVAAQFKFDGIIKDIHPVGEGLINDTFLVDTDGDAPNYILQRKNKIIFADVPAMMNNIEKVTRHLKKKIEEAGGNPMRETLTLIPTLDSKLFFQDAAGEYWAACYYIENTITHHKADSLKLAEQGGAGIGKFQAMLADMTEPLTDILPGFHNIRYRFGQWNETLTNDRAGRKAEVRKEIEWVENRRTEMLAFWQKVESGEIPVRVTHNDTKISNILFDKQDNVLCVIDLDTVLNNTCLCDYGDAIRSYANNGMEDDENTERVFLDMNIFEAYTQGYLSEAYRFLTPTEIENVAFSARYLIFEQMLRFLMDYIDGDRYYKVKNEKHNLVRARAQFKLLQSAEENYEAMCNIVNRIIAQLKNKQ